MPAGRGLAVDAGATSVEVVAGFYEAFNRGDIDATLEFLHPRFEWRPAFGRALMGHNVYLGRDGFRSYYRDIGEAFSEYHVEPRYIERIDADIVIVHGSTSGTGRTSCAKLARTFVMRYELRDGLLVRGETFDNRDEALRSK